MNSIRQQRESNPFSPTGKLGPLGRRVRLGWGGLNAVGLVALVLFLLLPVPRASWLWLLAPLLMFNIYDGYRAWKCGVCRLRRMGINTPL